MVEMGAIKIPTIAASRELTVMEGMEERHYLDLVLLQMEETVVHLIRIIALKDCVVVTEGMGELRLMGMVVEEMVAMALQQTVFVVLMRRRGSGIRIWFCC